MTPWSGWDLPQKASVALVALLMVGAVAVNYEPRLGADTAAGAYVACEDAVRERLKAPATAQFPDFREAFVRDLDKGVWQVMAHVDAENGFGALLRSDWTCRVLAASGRWNIQNLEMSTR